MLCENALRLVVFCTDRLMIILGMNDYQGSSTHVSILTNC